MSKEKVLTRNEVLDHLVELGRSFVEHLEALAPNEFTLSELKDSGLSETQARTLIKKMVAEGKMTVRHAMYKGRMNLIVTYIQEK